MSRGDYKTIPAPITAPIIHYEGQQARRLLWIIIVLEGLGLITRLI